MLEKHLESFEDSLGFLKEDTRASWALSYVTARVRPVCFRRTLSRTLSIWLERQKWCAPAHHYEVSTSFDFFQDDCENVKSLQQFLATTLIPEHPLNFTKSSIAGYWLEYLPVTMRHEKIRAEFNYNALTKRERPMKAELFSCSLVMEVLESCTKKGYKVRYLLRRKGKMREEKDLFDYVK
ncbi:hypothetical protein V1478_004623 [Vespula squamosa]|uniref:Uncharacterized protein n=1 Tax=Vespula squamosa TaxID=30214 RepID=A0ABD2BH14_VESSQ